MLIVDDIRVLMIDDQFLSRRGLEIVLGAADGIEVVGGLDADVGDNLVIDLRPDVVLVGSGPDSRRAEEVCSRVRAAVPARGSSSCPPPRCLPRSPRVDWWTAGSPARHRSTRSLRTSSVSPRPERTSGAYCPRR